MNIPINNFLSAITFDSKRIDEFIGFTIPVCFYICKPCLKNYVLNVFKLFKCTSERISQNNEINNTTILPSINYRSYLKLAVRRVFKKPMHGYFSQYIQCCVYECAAKTNICVFI